MVDRVAIVDCDVLLRWLIAMVDCDGWLRWLIAMWLIALRRFIAMVGCNGWLRGLITMVEGENVPLSSTQKKKDEKNWTPPPCTPLKLTARKLFFWGTNYSTSNLSCMYRFFVRKLTLCVGVETHFTLACPRPGPTMGCEAIYDNEEKSDGGILHRWPRSTIWHLEAGDVSFFFVWAAQNHSTDCIPLQSRPFLIFLFLRVMHRHAIVMRILRILVYCTTMNTLPNVPYVIIRDTRMYAYIIVIPHVM